MLEARALLNQPPNESQCLVAQASGGLDSKGEKLRPNSICQTIVQPVLLSLRLLQRAPRVVGTVLNLSSIWSG